MVEDEDAVGVLMATDGAGRVAFDDVAHGSLFLIEQSASLCHRGFWLLGWRSAGETLDEIRLDGRGALEGAEEGAGCPSAAFSPRLDTR